MNWIISIYFFPRSLFFRDDRVEYMNSFLANEEELELKSVEMHDHDIFLHFMYF